MYGERASPFRSSAGSMSRLMSFRRAKVIVAVVVVVVFVALRAGP
jgi:hypothetical protein